MMAASSYHNYGNPYGSVVGQVNAGTLIAGNKLRFTEYQAAIGLGQLKRLAEQTDVRNANAAYLHQRLGKIPGVIPYTLTPNVTKAAFHLFPFRYDRNGFKGLSRAAFLKALNAEGIPCSEGYAPLNKMPYLQNAFESKNYKKMYTAAELDIHSFNERNNCPLNDKLCNEEAVWFYQSMLLGTRADMDDIVNAIQKKDDNADKIKKRKPLQWVAMTTLLAGTVLAQDGAAPAQNSGASPKTLTAKVYNSGFDIAHDTYNAIDVASDGKVYYVLSSQSIDTGGQMFSFDPKTGKPNHCGDLTGSLWREGCEDDLAWQEPCAFCRIERNIVLRYPRWLLYDGGWDGKDGDTSGRV